MASPNHTLASPDISDVMKMLYMMKKQNEEILAKNEEILTKLNAIEDDNDKLRQELLEIKNYQKHSYNVKNSSRKRDDPDDEVEDQNEPSNSNKKARVSVSVVSSPQLEPPARFDSLDDDCLGNVLDFVGKKCYSAFGRVNKRCNEMFCSKGLPKETYLFGYGSLHLIKQKEGWRSGCSKGVLHYNRRDILDWMFTDESEFGLMRLKGLCKNAIRESRLDILREVFNKANGRQMKHLRDYGRSYNLCLEAAEHGKLEYLKLLRENECGWDTGTWFCAKQNGHEHILEYLRNNKFPTEWEI